MLCFAALYTYGGYIFESNQLISCLTKFKNNESLKVVFSKLEGSKNLRFIISSELHDAIINRLLFKKDKYPFFWYLYIKISEKLQKIKV